MRLKSNIFWLVLLATVIPLTLLVTGATIWSEQQYRQKVDDDVTASLNNIVAEIQRRLFYERQLILSLKNSDNLKKYLPVLKDTSVGNIHPEFFKRGEQLKEFLAGFQSVVPGFSAIRILDRNANSLILVRFGRGYLGDFDGIESFPFAEDEVEDEDFSKRLKALPDDEMSFVLLPQNKSDRNARPQSLLTAIVPLMVGKERVGYIAADFKGDQVDQILSLGTRVHKGELLIAEINPLEKARNGLVLYDDAQKLKFASTTVLGFRLDELYGGRLWNAVQKNPDGIFSSRDERTRTYYVEFLPYPNRLNSWVIAARLHIDVLQQPFYHIRIGIVIFAAVAVVLSLVLANFGARRVSGPVCELARGMKQYANGDQALRVRARGVDELKQLEESFNYMADTLEHAQKERDKAHYMMLQSDKLASIGQMASGIGHEINNPLNNILSYTKLALRSIGDEQPGLKQDLESLREEALRASGIVRGVLDFARQGEPSMSVFEVQQWLDESIALVAQTARSKQVTIISPADVDISIEGDRGQLQQVLINLLINAIDASDRDSEIHIVVEADERLCHIDVIDQGCGIDETILNRIYDPFFSTKPEGQGTGLGLSISLGIVEHHGGKLIIVNNSGKGVTATIMLPYTQE